MRLNVKNALSLSLLKYYMQYVTLLLIVYARRWKVGFERKIQVQCSCYIAAVYNLRTEKKKRSF